MKIWDISRPLTNDLAPWPGDVPFKFQLNRRIPSGDTVNLGSIEMSVHNGTHADAVFHFDNAGATIERAPLDAYFGRAAVVDLDGQFAQGGKGLIDISDLLAYEALLRETSRLLVKTGIWKNSAAFPKWIPVIASNVPEWLRERGIKLFGLDLPSVDPLEAAILKNHHALARAGICIVESLDLGEVTAGVYDFAAFPLKISGGDGAPVRAVLWRDAN
jgi:arylformamidase